MDISQELKAATERRAETVNRLNEVKRQEQDCLQELLKIEGEVRLLTRMASKENKDADRTKG